MRPNPSVKRTRNGVACLALISFWAKHATPLRSAYLERYVSQSTYETTRRSHSRALHVTTEPKATLNKPLFLTNSGNRFART